MYRKYEIEGFKMHWLPMFAELRVDDSLICDAKDAPRIRVAISNSFHKRKLARFSVKLNKNNKQELIVKRLA